jgi:hypothetical protein
VVEKVGVPGLDDLLSRGAPGSARILPGGRMVGELLWCSDEDV